MSSFEQALELFKMVCALKYISATIIQDEMGVSRATAYRYMQTLKSVFSLEETADSGVYRLPQSYAINSKLKKYEKDFLDYVLTYYGKSLNTKVDNVSLMNPNVIIGEEPVADAQVMENYEKLYRQIRDSCKCSFLYKDHTQPHIVEPYNLIYYHNSHYLLAKHGDTEKTFRLDLISDIKDTGEVYIIEEKIIEEYRAKAKTIWHDVNKQADDVFITVDASVAAYFKKRQLLPAQTIVKESEDGSITVAFQSSSLMEFQQLLLGWFGKFKVVKPKKYADYIARIIETYR